MDPLVVPTPAPEFEPQYVASAPEPIVAQIPDEIQTEQVKEPEVVVVPSATIEEQPPRVFLPPPAQPKDTSISRLAILQNFAKLWCKSRLDAGRLSNDYTTDSDIRMVLQTILLGPVEVSSVLKDEAKRISLIRGVLAIRNGDWIGSDNCFGEGILCFVDFVPSPGNVYHALTNGTPYDEQGRLKIEKTRRITQDDLDSLKTSVQLVVYQHITSLFALAITIDWERQSRDENVKLMAQEVAFDMLTESQRIVPNHDLVKLTDRIRKTKEAIVQMSKEAKKTSEETLVKDEINAEIAMSTR
jgi:hypothetical protein